MGSAEASRVWYAVGTVALIAIASCAADSQSEVEGEIDASPAPRPTVHDAEAPGIWTRDAGLPGDPDVDSAASDSAHNSDRLPGTAGWCGSATATNLACNSSSCACAMFQSPLGRARVSKITPFRGRLWVTISEQLNCPLLLGYCNVSVATHALDSCDGAPAVLTVQNGSAPIPTGAGLFYVAYGNSPPALAGSALMRHDCDGNTRTLRGSVDSLAPRRMRFGPLWEHRDMLYFHEELSECDEALTPSDCPSGWRVRRRLVSMPTAGTGADEDLSVLGERTGLTGDAGNLIGTADIWHALDPNAASLRGDGSELYWIVDGELYRALATGGDPEPVPMGLSEIVHVELASEHAVLATQTEVWALPRAGGTPSRLFTADANARIRDVAVRGSDVYYLLAPSAAAVDAGTIASSLGVVAINGGSALQVALPFEDVTVLAVTADQALIGVEGPELRVVSLP